MRITMRTLQAALNEHYKTELYGEEPAEIPFSRWELLRGQPVSPLTDTIYLSDSTEDVPRQRRGKACSLLFCASPGFDVSSLLPIWQGRVLLVYTAQADGVFTAIRKLFHAEGLKDEMNAVLLEAFMKGKGVQGLTDAAYPFLKNPILVFNAAYRISGVTSDAARAQESEVTDLLLENGGFSSSDYDFANRDELHSRVKKSSDPILAFHERLQTNQLLITVSAEKDYGHIAVNESEHAFSTLDRELLLILRNFIYLQMKQEELQSRNGIRASEHFILDLLDEAIIVNSSYHNFIKHLDFTFPKYMRCLLVSTELTPGAVNTGSIENQIYYLFPDSKMVEYEKKIVGLIPVPGNGKIQESIADSLRTFFRKNKLYASISNSFDNVMDLRLYYKQSLRALEAGRSVKDEPGLYLYEDYYLAHLKNLFLQKEALSVFLCPALKHLSNHDRKHHTELAHTLYMYLTNDRNLLQTAKAMNMHRSSLIYRFDKITELLGELPESIMERQYYILSYQFSNGAFPK